ncbi:MAG: ATP-binding protein [Lachnospiraceae bacterium]|nr:ATP-binding protein [Lachnospiraceae bacterium]
MRECPINFYTGNLIFNADKSCWAAFKLTGFDYDFLNQNEKIGVLFQTARFLAGIFSEVQILILPVSQNIEAHYDALKQGLDKEDVLYDTAYNYTEQIEEYLKERTSENDSNDYRAYIFAKMEGENSGDLISSKLHALQFFIKNPVNAVNVFFNVDTKDILMSKVEQAKKAADAWYFSQNQKVSMNEVQGEELQWIFRRIAYRGLQEMVPLFYQDSKKGVWQPKYQMDEVGNEKFIHPWGRDVKNLFSGSIVSKDRVVRVEHDRMTSYQTFLAITGLPDEIEFPGNEWIYMLQRESLQAEVCIHIRAIEYREAGRKLDGKKREIDSQSENAAKGGAEIPEDLLTGAEYANMMEQEIKTNKDPILETAISVCVSADSAQRLEERVATIRETYQDMNFVVERPIADQVKLFMSFIPTVGITVKDYVMQLTPTTLASGVIGANRELGDGKGAYIGTTGKEGKNVYLNMGLACLANKSASATFFGNLGFGKSFNANLLVFLNVIYGGYALIFDPKGERSHWEKEFTLLEGLISTVTLAADKENTGMLDPYNIYSDNLDEANELAINVLTEMFKFSPNSMEYTALLEAANKLSEDTSGKLPSMLRLAEILESFDEADELCKPAKMIARRIRLHRAAGMARLLIGEGGEQTISLENRLNILQIQNLKLPSPETPKADYTTEESVSTVIMMVLSHFAKKFALIPRNVFSAILFDESWALGKTAEGVKMYDYLTRMGRSLFTGCIFNGHSVLDIPTEGIKNTITYKFCFCTTNEAEAVRMCEYLGLEPNAQNKTEIMNLRNGECMFQDLDKHVGILKFDAVFQDIIDVFSTTPKAKNQEKEEDTAGEALEESMIDKENMREDEMSFSVTEEPEEEEEIPVFDFEEYPEEEPSEIEEITEGEEPEGIKETGEAIQTDIEMEIDYDKIMRDLMKREVV